MRTRRRSTRRSMWFWLFIAVVVVLLLGIFFGGYRKGTKVGSPEVPGPATTSISVTY
jgi:Na+/H+-dicarboxylate symporter